MTGPRYLQSLNDGREIWLDGQRVHDVPNHPAFTGVVHELARIYDLQHSPEYRDRMTFTSPETGNPCSISWLLPRSIDDLKRKRVNSELWNRECWGQFGRSPDILAPYIITLYDARDALSALKHPKCDFGQNAVNYYRYCAENDLFLTHALGDPQVDRSEQPQNEQRLALEEELALHVVEETSEGVIVSGGKQLATAAPISNECYVSLSATFVRPRRPSHGSRLLHPHQQPRPQDSLPRTRFPIPRRLRPPFAMRYDEQDAMLFFDHVLVPWDRLFMLYDASPQLQRLGAGINFIGWANLCRVHQRMRLLTAVATLIAEAIGVIEYREVSAKLGEMATYCEVWRHAMDGIEYNSFTTPGGLMSLGDQSGMNIFFSQTSARMVQLLREICGSGLIMQPSENDLASPELRPYLERYMRGKGVDVDYKSRLYRLANDLAVSSFGMRQEVYEYWHAGDPNRNRINLLRTFHQDDIVERIKELLREPLAHS